MNTELDRFEIERVMRGYSNDLMQAFSAIEQDESKQRNELARVQSLLSDIDYLNEVAQHLREQVSKCRRKYYLQQIKSIVK